MALWAKTSSSRFFGPPTASSKWSWWWRYRWWSWWWWWWISRAKSSSPSFFVRQTAFSRSSLYFISLSTLGNVDEPGNHVQKICFQSLYIERWYEYVIWCYNNIIWPRRLTRTRMELFLRRRWPHGQSWLSRWSNNFNFNEHQNL